MSTIALFTHPRMMQLIGMPRWARGISQEGLAGIANFRELDVGGHARAPPQARVEKHR
jgi:hypothetical protein